MLRPLASPELDHGCESWGRTRQALQLLSAHGRTHTARPPHRRDCMRGVALAPGVPTTQALPWVALAMSVRAERPASPHRPRRLSPNPVAHPGLSPPTTFRHAPDCVAALAADAGDAVLHRAAVGPGLPLLHPRPHAPQLCRARGRGPHGRRPAGAAAGGAGAPQAGPPHPGHRQRAGPAGGAAHGTGARWGVAPGLAWAALTLCRGWPGSLRGDCAEEDTRQHR